MADKRIQPKAPDKAQPAAGARKAERETVKHGKNVVKMHKNTVKHTKGVAKAQKHI